MEVKEMKNAKFHYNGAYDFDSILEKHNPDFKLEWTGGFNTRLFTNLTMKDGRVVGVWVTDTSAVMNKKILSTEEDVAFSEDGLKVSETEFATVEDVQKNVNLYDSFFSEVYVDIMHSNDVDHLAIVESMETIFTQDDLMKIRNVIKTYDNLMRDEPMDS